MSSSLIDVIDGGSQQKLSMLSNTIQVSNSLLGAGLRLEMLTSNGLQKSAERSTVEPLIRLHLQGRTRLSARHLRRRSDIDLQRGSLAIFSAGLTMHDLEWRASKAHFLLLSINPHSMRHNDAIAEKILTQLNTNLGFFDPTMAHLLGALNHLLRERHSPDPLLLDTIGLSVTTYLASRHCHGSSTVASQHSGKARLRHAVELMENHYGKTITLADLAAAVGLSVYHFSHSFKKVYGVSPLRFLRDIRLETAQRLLLQNNNSIAEIALQCGFSSQSHFTQVYRSAKGITPAHERRFSPPVRACRHSLQG